MKGYSSLWSSSLLWQTSIPVRLVNSARTKGSSYNENRFLRTVEGNPMIDKAYKMALAAA